jgi:AcrR family transcriptional regulator
MIAMTTQREEILVAALEVYAERGYRGTSLDTVAERAGLTRQGLLHYFPSKKKLLIALLQFREDRSREHLAADHADKDWPSQLAEAVAFDHQNPVLAEVHSVLLADSITGSDPDQHYLHDHQQLLQDRTVALFTERYGPRLPSGLTPQTAATAVLAMVEGMQHQWLLEPEQTDYPAIMRDVMTVLLGSATECPPTERPPTERPRSE